MIARLSGTLLDKRPPTVVVDVHGTGYEVDVPMSTFYDLPQTGASVVLLTHLVVREDAHLLYGFRTDAERAVFRQLIRIGGVGPRIALAILSGLSVDELAQAVAAQDAARLQRVPGIGRKTAERLLLELEGKLTGVAQVGSPSAAPREGSAADVVNALLALGYSEREATSAASRLPADCEVGEGIRLALKQLARA